MSTQAPAQKRQKRVPFWDNAKWLAMLLVVVGHAIQPLATDAALVPYLVIYAFHMPFFGVISGYFTTAKPGVKHYRRVLGDLIVPYIVFEMLWACVDWLMHRGEFSFNPATASWTLWFLLALAFFRIALPVIAMLRWPLLWVAALAVVAGYWSQVDQTFSVMRTIGMLPFFTLGWQLRKWGIVDRWLDASRTWPLRVAAIGVFGAFTLVIAIFPEFWRQTDLRHWFFLDRAYDELTGGDGANDGLIRLVVMLGSTLLIAAALVLVPRSRTFFSGWGAATMHIYLLHTFVLYWPRDSGWLAAQWSTWWALPLAVLLGLAATILLSQAWLHRVTRLVVEPNVDWMLRSVQRAERGHHP